MTYSNIDDARRKANNDIMDTLFIKSGVYLLENETTLHSLQEHLRINEQSLCELIDRYKPNFEISLKSNVKEEKPQPKDILLRLNKNGVIALRSRLISFF
jgi:hypothetical protein